jgi:hypothetical protein
MQMIDVLKRLAELDAQNPNIVQEKRVDESLDECGMMGGMGMSHPHSPASINMTAATGEELSSMLKDIMTLAGQSNPAPEMPMGGEEPMAGADGIAVVDVEPSVDAGPDVGADDTSVMRSMIDKLNPSDDDAGDASSDDTPSADADDSSSDDDEEEKVDEYDNTPDEQVAGYDAAVPSGNDLHKEKKQYPAAQRGDNPMAATYESLMAEYRKFLGEDQEVAEISQKLAAKAYNKMAVGDDPWKNRTGLAGDQSDRMKARMDKRWGKDAADAAVKKDQDAAEGKLPSESVSEEDTMESMLKLAGLKK